MSENASKPRVGILGLTLELYEELCPQLRGGREQWIRNDIIPALERICDVTFDGAVFTREGVEKAVGKFEAAGLDAIIVIMLSYSPSQIAASALARTSVPILVWNTQELFAVDDSFGNDEMLHNHGVHGTQDLCNVLLRCGGEFELVTSHLSDDDALDEIEDFLTAAAAVTQLRSLRTGLLGYAFPGMGDLAIDTTHLIGSLGCSCEPLSMDEYLKLSADVDSAAAACLAAEYRSEYELAGDLTDEDLDHTARAELALRGMLEERNINAFSYQFMAFGDDSRSVTLPFVAASRLMADGVGFAGEGDVVGAIGTWLLNRLMSPATFSEIFTIDFAGNGVFMSHMGEMNVAMARKARMIARENKITATTGRQLAIVQDIAPGDGTLFALTQDAMQGWTLLASRVVISDENVRSGFETPHFKLTPASGDVRDFLTAYTKSGGPHHNAVCLGDARNRIMHAARLLGADYCEV